MPIDNHCPLRVGTVRSRRASLSWTRQLVDHAAPSGNDHEDRLGSPCTSGPRRADQVLIGGDPFEDHGRARKPRYQGRATDQVLLVTAGDRFCLSPIIMVSLRSEPELVISSQRGLRRPRGTRIHDDGHRTSRLGNTPFESAFADDFGHFDSPADVFRQIAHDERVHKLESEALMKESRFR